MKAPFSNILFLRSYIGIVLGIVAVALLLDLLLARFSSTDTEDALRSSYAPLFSVVSDDLLALDAKHRQQALAALSHDWDFPAQLIPLHDFAPPEVGEAELDFSQIQLFFDNNDGALLYQKLGDTDQVLAFGPLPVPNTSANDTWVISAYYALIGLVLLLWIRPFARDLGLLRRAAADFGRADFAARVKLPETSSILPVGQSFNAMAERIEYLVSVHKELTNAVSHELRTPLARFKFTLEMLARYEDPERKQRYLDEMKTDVNELETLIDEMLTYARLGEHNLVLHQEQVDLKQWLERELRVYEREPIQVTCSFSCLPTEAAQHGDFSANYRASLNPDLMARALHNVVRNGLRYARERISLHLHCNGTVTLRVCDDGPGIPPEKHASIFEPFSRLETSRDRQSGGYGLGLAIAARILKRHEGSITVYNCEPDGACFVLEWPRQSVGPMLPATQPRAIQHIAR
jgi:signal transduction histidine kinase